MFAAREVGARRPTRFTSALVSASLSLQTHVSWFMNTGLATPTIGAFLSQGCVSVYASAPKTCASQLPLKPDTRTWRSSLGGSGAGDTVPQGPAEDRWGASPGRRLWEGPLFC